MRCVVTGCAGFISSHLCSALVRRGDHVIGIDALTDYYDPRLKRRNLAELKPFQNFTFIPGDISRMDLKPALSGVDVIFHNAAQPGVRASWGGEFNVYVRDNILATQRLLEYAMRAKKLKKFVFASSSSVYGNVDRLPMKETQVCRPHSPYGVTKLAAEQLGLLYHANYGMPVTALRYFTVYGPRQRPDMGFHRFIQAALRHKPIRVYGDGRQVRDFTYVDDVVAANLAAARAGRPGGIYNIGGGHRVMLKDVLDLVARLTGEELDLVYEDVQRGDVQATGADCGLARKELGFKPQTTLTAGLEAQIAWHRAMREKGVL